MTTQTLDPHSFLLSVMTSLPPYVLAYLVVFRVVATSTKLFTTMYIVHGILFLETLKH